MHFPGVAPERVGTRVAATALIASERPFSRVIVHVLGKLRVGKKSFVANGTSTNPFVFVSPHVDFQSVFPFRGKPAYLTDEFAFGRVNGHVYPDAVFRVELFLANFASEIDPMLEFFMIQ